MKLDTKTWIKFSSPLLYTVAHRNIETTDYTTKYTRKGPAQVYTGGTCT